MLYNSFWWILSLFSSFLQLADLIAIWFFLYSVISKYVALPITCLAMGWNV